MVAITTYLSDAVWLLN